MRWAYCPPACGAHDVQDDGPNLGRHVGKVLLGSETARGGHHCKEHGAAVALDVNPQPDWKAIDLGGLPLGKLRKDAVPLCCKELVVSGNPVEALLCRVNCLGRDARD